MLLSSIRVVSSSLLAFEHLLMQHLLCYCCVLVVCAPAVGCAGGSVGELAG